MWLDCVRVGTTLDIYYKMMIKRLLTTVAFAVGFIAANAQFVLTQNGFVDKDNINHDYVVVKMDSLCADSISSVICSNLKRDFLNGEDRISRDGNTIYVSGNRNNAIAGKLMGMYLGGAYHIIFKFTIETKDGRARVMQPDLKLSLFAEKEKYPNYTASDWRNAVSFKKNGEVRTVSTAKSLEKFVNDFVASLTYRKDADEW